MRAGRDDLQGAEFGSENGLGDEPAASGRSVGASVDGVAGLVVENDGRGVDEAVAGGGAGQERHAGQG